MQKFAWVTNVDFMLIYIHHFGFQIITGTKAWEFFCSWGNIDVDELINFIRSLVSEKLNVDRNKS